MRVLISGGAGFLGINLVRYLLDRDVREITSLDIAPFGYPERERIHALCGDIRDPASVHAATEGADVVVHAAAALPLYSPRDIYDTDVRGTRTLLAAAAAHDVKRFIMISSTAVYGVPDHHPLLESDPLVGVGPYGRAKILAEEACLVYRARGMCVPILRPKTFVGPERLGAFSILYDWARDGRAFPMVGSGRNRYQLLDVEDLCQAIWLCAILDREAVSDTFNIGAAQFATMREDWQAVLDAAGHGRRIRPLPAWPAVVALRVLDLLGLSPLYRWVYETAGKDSFVSIERAWRRLGFRPRYSTQEALVRSFRWYLANLDSVSATAGVSHRVPWAQGVLSLMKHLF